MNLQQLAKEWRRIAKAHRLEAEIGEYKEAYGEQMASDAYARCADDLEKALAGWVACSERMPEKGYYLAWIDRRKSNYPDHAQILWTNGSAWNHNEPYEPITHWTPLPAGPQPPGPGGGSDG